MKTDDSKPKCKQCQKRNAQARLGDLCRACFDANGALDNAPKLMRKAQSQKDWVALAESLSDTFSGVAMGTVKASAGQAALLKVIWERAYGRPNKTQEDLAGASGVVILPTVGNNEFMTICPQCLSRYDRVTLIKWNAFLRKEGKEIGNDDNGDSNRVDVRGIGGEIDNDFSAPSPSIQVENRVDGSDAGVQKEAT